MTPPSQDLVRRRPVWEAMSYLFLDTGWEEADLRRMAGVLAASPYSSDELDAIFWGEAYPACIFNLSHFTGDWDRFDVDEVEFRVLAMERKFWLRWRCCQWRRGTVRDEWRRVADLAREERERRRRE